MESATAVRCPGCSYENNPFYRYCGMCGSPLKAGDAPLPPEPVQPLAAKISEPMRAPAPPPAPPAPEPPRKTTPITINGFSILGLSDDPGLGVEAHDQLKNHSADHGGFQDRPLFGSSPDFAPSRNVQYLLEDEEPGSRTNWRMYVAIALLAAAAGTLVWHWQTNGYPWEQSARERAARRAALVAQAAEVPSTTNSLPASTPKPSPVPPVPEPSTELSHAEEPQVATLPAANPESKPNLVPDSKAAEPASEASKVLPVEEDPAPAKETAVPAKKTPRAPEPTSLPLAPSNAIVANDPAHLFNEGEKYLYGDGVPQDCDRAQKALRTSAAHSYPQAESLLGTMYASGHCLGRDLPAAYRWYARALRHEPANTRIASDLQVLWTEMTAAEKKAAQSGGQ